MEEIMKVVGPLLGVVLGAVISGIGVLWKARQERKKAIGVALADLLEIRHRVYGVENIIRFMSDQHKMSPDWSPAIREVVDKAMPLDEKIATRFDDAISLLAGVDPILAFSLRSKEVLPQILRKFRGEMLASGSGAAEYGALESALLHATKPALDDAVMVLAENYSWSTGRRVREILAQRSELPPDFSRVLTGTGASISIDPSAPPKE